MRIGRILILLALAASCAVKPDCSLQRIGEGFAATTVNTCVFRGASVTSDGYYRAAAFYDADSYVNIAFQKQGSDTWDVTRTQYKGHTADAHNVISIALDGEGFLHMAFDMHSAPLKYCRSLEPYSAVMGEFQPMTGTGEADVTYPEFHRLSNGDLLFFYRDGESGRGNLVLNRYNLQQQQWQRVQDVLIDGEGRRNAYPQMYVDSKDGIHLSWVWRETWDVSTNHDMCYAYSPDAGVSWQRTDGTSYELPITLFHRRICLPHSSGKRPDEPDINDSRCLRASVHCLILDIRRHWHPPIPPDLARRPQMEPEHGWAAIPAFQPGGRRHQKGAHRQASAGGYQRRRILFLPRGGIRLQGFRVPYRQAVFRQMGTP